MSTLPEFAESTRNPNLAPMWRPGQSGNPHGITGLVATVRRALVTPEDPDGTGVELLAALRMIALNPRARDADRIAASRELLDRRYGKAPVLALVADTGGRRAELDEAIRAVLGELTEQPPDVEGSAAE